MLGLSQTMVCVGHDKLVRQAERYKNVQSKMTHLNKKFASRSK